MSAKISTVPAPARVAPHVDQYLAVGQEGGASDVHLGVNAPPLWRLYGNLQPIWPDAPKLTAKDTAALVAGFLTEAELHQVWLRAGALFFPSLHEGFGIPLLEAMHYGVPIIASNQFSLKEVAGDASYQIDPRKPIEISQALGAVSTDKHLREKLASAGRERLALFNVKVAARALLDAFSSLTRREHDFPRKPRYALEPPVLAVATPASGGTWKIEILYEDDGWEKCSVYLGETPFACFTPSPRRRGKFSFVCRPEGRPLGFRFRPLVNAAREESDESRRVITRIVASQPNGRHILLYERAKEMAIV